MSPGSAAVLQRTRLCTRGIVRALYEFPSNAGLDLKSRRGELSEAGSSSKRRRRRRAGSEDDDDDWVPGVEEAPRRSRRGKPIVTLFRGGFSCACA